MKKRHYVVNKNQITRLWSMSEEIITFTWVDTTNDEQEEEELAFSRDTTFDTLLSDVAEIFGFESGAVTGARVPGTQEIISREMLAGDAFDMHGATFEIFYSGDDEEEKDVESAGSDDGGQ